MISGMKLILGCLQLKGSTLPEVTLFAFLWVKSGFFVTNELHIVVKKKITLHNTMNLNLRKHAWLGFKSVIDR